MGRGTGGSALLSCAEAVSVKVPEYPPHWGETILEMIFRHERMARAAGARNPQKQDTKKEVETTSPPDTMIELDLEEELEDLDL